MLSIALYGLPACHFGVYFCSVVELVVELVETLSRHAPPFLSCKMIARDLLGCSGQVGSRRDLQAFFWL